MNTCNRDELLLLAAGEATPQQAAETERHVAKCAACATELARLREDLAALDRLPILEPSGEAVRRIALAGRLAVGRRRTVRPLLRRARPLLAVAASLAVVFFIGALFNGPGFAPSVADLPPEQLDRIWETPASDLASAEEMVDGLIDQHAGSQWTVAEAAVLRTASESNLDAELLRLDESMEQLEGLSWDS